MSLCSVRQSIGLSSLIQLYTRPVGTGPKCSVIESARSCRVQRRTSLELSKVCLRPYTRPSRAPSTAVRASPHSDIFPPSRDLPTYNIECPPSKAHASSPILLPCPTLDLRIVQSYIVYHRKLSINSSNSISTTGLTSKLKLQPCVLFMLSPNMHLLLRHVCSLQGSKGSMHELHCSKTRRCSPSALTTAASQYFSKCSFLFHSLGRKHQHAF
jgi:hypothetical protein